MRHRFCALAITIVCVASFSPETALAQVPAVGAAAADSTAGITGKVVETMDAGQYTYVLVDDGAKKVWAAAPQFTVAVGNQVVVPSGMVMRNFESKSLGRTFDVVYFVSAIEVSGAKPAGVGALPAHGRAEKDALPGQPAHGAAGAAPAAVDVSNIKKAAGGQTIAELFANKATLAGKPVVVRGRVVKFTPAVMDKNWMHIQDGSGSAGTNDLTVSTKATAAVGNLVVVRGKLGTDKDLGFGYHYDLIVEDGEVTIEE